MSEVVILKVITPTKADISDDSQWDVIKKNLVLFAADATSEDCLIMDQTTNDLILKKLGKPLPYPNVIVVANRNGYTSDRHIIKRSVLNAIRARHTGKTYVLGDTTLSTMVQPYAHRKKVLHIVDGKESNNHIDHTVWKFDSGETTFRKWNKKRCACSFIEYVKRVPVATLVNSLFVMVLNARSWGEFFLLLQYMIQELCPFCIETQLLHHGKEIILISEHWLITHNKWPRLWNQYDFLLILRRRHVDDYGQITQDEKEDLDAQYKFLQERFGFLGYKFTIRSGKMLVSKAPVAHIYVEFEVPWETFTQFCKYWIGKAFSAVQKFLAGVQWVY